MLKTKLVTTLDALPKEEWVLLKRHLMATVDSDTNLYHLFEFFFRNRNRLDKIQQEDLQAIPKMQRLSTKGVSNLSSKLLQEVDVWLIKSELYKSRFEPDILLVKALNRRGVYHRADQEARRIASKITNAKTLNLEQTEALAKLYSAQYYSNNPIKRSKGNTLFKDCVSQFTLSTIERASKLRVELRNRIYIMNNVYDHEKEILDKILALAEGTEMSAIFRLTLEVIEHENLDAFEELKSILEQGRIEPSTNLELILIGYLSIAANIFSRQNKITALTVVEITQLKFSAIERHDSYKLLPVNFYNGVDRVSTILSFEESEKFIRKWNNKVHTKCLDSSFSYAMAINAFRHDRYEMIPLLVNGLELDYTANKLISLSLIHI